MIFSRSARYAIQALVVLAGQPKGRYMMCQALARELGLPQAYLGKIMIRLIDAGMVESTRGRLGGYKLRVNPHSVFLKQVVEVISAGRFHRECLLGLKACSDDSACAMHCQWQPVKAHVLAMLEEQNVGHLAESVASGRYQLDHLNVAGLMHQGQ